MTRRDEERQLLAPEPALRVMMRSLRAIMSEPADGQTRLDKIVHQIAGVMVVEVCSIYLRRQDGSLELFATEGLRPEAVHQTRLKRAEGLVGRCAEFKVTVNEPDARKNHAFAYRPETGEDLYHSMLAVPIERGGEVLGVLVVQNRRIMQYSDEDVELLQTTAMVVAELLVSGAVIGRAALAGARSQPVVLTGEVISEGIALGHAFLHEPRVVVDKWMADDPASEMRRLEGAISTLKKSLDEMFGHEHLAGAGEHRDVLEAYRMFAHDRGWERRLHEAVQGGLTAGGAVERVLNSTRERVLRANDPFWRERQKDLDDLSERLLRILAGRAVGDSTQMPSDTVLIARSMGPAELIEYDRLKLRGVVVEDSSHESHLAIVAKALGVPAVAKVKGIVERIGAGDEVILDAEAGKVHVRPPSDVKGGYQDKVRFRARRQRRYRALRDTPAVTKDGVRITLSMNAGFLVDMPHLAESGADGVGLFRTELLFMLSNRLPRLLQQTDAYRAVMAEAAGKPVVFRALDVGGDKVLPYVRQKPEDNPALGLRAIRMSLDRSATLLRIQVRALLIASAGGNLDLMIPMVTSAHEMDLVRAVIDKERAIVVERGHALPKRVNVGAMIEVPSLLFELDELLSKVDFVSVGSNDLLQFLFAADRSNPDVASRYDALSAAPLRALKQLVRAAKKHRVPLAICGEMAGRPLEAMALIGLGIRSISMAPASIGPVKTMILSLDSGKVTGLMDGLLKNRHPNIREALVKFAAAEKVEI